MYHIVRRIRGQVFFPEVFQDLHLDERLMMESLFVPARTRVGTGRLSEGTKRATDV